MAIPSQAWKHFREGVETRREAPKPHVGNGEGIVQTTNPPSAGRRKPKWYENPQAARPCGFNSLRPHHTRFLSGPGSNHPGISSIGTGAGGPAQDLLTILPHASVSSFSRICTLRCYRSARYAQRHSK
jgi:hypothetical protein